ncbi:MAG: cache domain-containing protein [Tenuifilaceae bacterium]|nr:cache domain-containing protein [Tenuifilaceae bacterium]
MKIKLNVRQKISVFVLGVALILFAVTIGYFSTTSQRAARKNLTSLTISYTDHYAMVIESWLNSDIAVARTMSSTFLEHKQLPFEQWRELIMGMYRQVMITNPHFDAIWDSWELTYLDPNWDKPYGRWLHIITRQNGRLVSRYEQRSIEGDPAAYGALKASAKESVIEPYVSDFQQGGLMTSLVTPMNISGRFIGVVGIDLFLGRFQELIASIKPYDEGNAFLISNQGTFVAHADTSIFSRKIQEVFPNLVEQQQIMHRIKRGQKFSFTHKDEAGESYFYSFSPIAVGRTETPWSLGMAIPERTILKDANKSYNTGLMVGVIGMIVLVITVILLADSITKPIKHITRLLEDLAHGRIDRGMHVQLNTGDEVARMGDALNKSIDGLLAKTEFAKSIEEGKLDSELTLLSNEDVLGKSLLDMRESLRKAKEDERQRKVEDDKRRWINEGLAKFGDILRQNNDNLSRLSEEIIKNLVWYLKADLGGIFVKNENNTPVTYDLAASFAYDRNRFLNKSFELGDGLIGTCAAEKGTIYLKELPENYVEIRSGLGTTNPNNVLIVPLIIEGEVMGVTEIASLKILEPFEIEFVEIIGESIASTLRTVRVNQRTTELLQKSQEQAEVMAAQEEEMRQNLEELQATQEEATRKSIEMEGIIEALNASAYVMEYDSKGKIININDAYLDLLGLKRSETIGTHHSDNLVLTEQQRMHYEEFWSNLRKGEVQKQTTRVNISGKEFVFLETYTPIRDANGKVYKILKVATDITNATD